MGVGSGELAFQDPDGVEEFGGANDEEHDPDNEDFADEGECDVEKLLPVGSAVEMGGLVEFFGDALHGGEEEDHVKADGGPDDHRDEGVNEDGRVFESEGKGVGHEIDADGAQNALDDGKGSVEHPEIGGAVQEAPKQGYGYGG